MNDKKSTPAKSATKTTNAKGDNNKVEQSSFAFAFGPLNYILLGIGILLLGIGYILLAGGGSDDPNVFNPAMFNTRRLVVSPLLIVGGLIIELIGIMLRPKDNNIEQ